MLDVSAARRALAAVGVLAAGIVIPACGGSSQKPATRSTASMTTTASATTTSTQSSAARTPRPRQRTTTTQRTPSTTTRSATTPTTTSTTRTPATTPTTTTSSSSTHPYTAPVRVGLTAPNHSPLVNANWSYTVTVVDATGRKLSGTETTQYLYNGAVVGTEKPTNVPFRNGVYHDTIQFPPASVGYPLVVRTVVHTIIGTAHADWPVKVRKA